MPCGQRVAATKTERASAASVQPTAEGRRVPVNLAVICVGVTDADPQQNERPRGGRSGSSRKREELGNNDF